MAYNLFNCDICINYQACEGNTGCGYCSVKNTGVNSFGKSCKAFRYSTTGEFPEEETFTIEGLLSCDSVKVVDEIFLSGNFVEVDLTFFQDMNEDDCCEDDEDYRDIYDGDDCCEDEEWNKDHG